MARHRKIDVRMWADEKFRELSPPPPNGRDCWIYLLTNPYTTSIPGVYHAFEETLAKGLGWSVKGFREAFAELLVHGLAKADWGVGFVFIPKAFFYNKPDNPNVVKSWRIHWDELPECALKREVFWHLKTLTEGLGEGFAKAFANGCRQGLANQEQEQDQDLVSSVSASSVLNASDLDLLPESLLGSKPRFDLEAIYDAYPRKEGKAAGIDVLKRRIKTQADYEARLSSARNYAAKMARDGVETGFMLLFSTWANGRWQDYVDGAPALAVLPRGASRGNEAPMKHTAVTRDVTKEYT